MDLTGFVTAVTVKAAITRRCSVIPPLQIEASASVWETGEGGTENIADLQINTLKSKRLLPSRFKVGKLTFSTRLFIVEPMPPSLQRPPHRGAGAKPRRALSPVSLA